MSYRQHRIDTSTADGFLQTRRNQDASGLPGRIIGRLLSLPHRIAEHHRRTVLRRQTMDAMGKLDERMMKDVGWPGHYDPEGMRQPDDR